MNQYLILFGADNETWLTFAPTPADALAEFRAAGLEGEPNQVFKLVEVIGLC